MLYKNNSVQLSDELSQIWNNPLSHFYYDKYRNTGLSEKDICNPDTFTKIPFLTRKEMEDTLPLDRLYIPEGDVDFVALTSGTTGSHPVISLHRMLDTYKYDPTLGVDVHRILVTYPPFNKNFGPMFVQMCKESPREVFPISADYQNLANSAVIARDTLSDALYATPTIATLLAPFLEKYYSTENIKLVVLCSETLTKARRTKLGTLYPNAIIANTYGSSEIGRHIFFPCAKMLKEKVSHFHTIHDDIAVTELIDDELVITYLKNKAFPLIRYRTGDYFYELPKCSCRLPGPVLGWRGREDVDRLRVNGIELLLEDVESTFLSLTPLIGNQYQLHLYPSSDGRIRMVIEIEKNGLPDTDVFREHTRLQVIRVVKELRIGGSATLSDAVKQSLFINPDVQFVEELSVKTTKPRRLINHIN